MYYMFSKKYPITYLKHKITGWKLFDLCKFIFKIYVSFSNARWIPYKDAVWIAQLHLDMTIIPKERRVFSTGTEPRSHDIFYSCPYSTRNIPKSYWPYQRQEQISFLVLSPCVRKMCFSRSVRFVSRSRDIQIDSSRLRPHGNIAYKNSTYANKCIVIQNSLLFVVVAVRLLCHSSLIIPRKEAKLWQFLPRKKDSANRRL